MKFQEFSEFISGYLILKSGSTDLIPKIMLVAIVTDLMI